MDSTFGLASGMMGKSLKKGQTPPSVRRRHAMVSKNETKESDQSEEITMESCVHFDKRFKLDELLKSMKYCQQIKCGECKEEVHVKRSSLWNIYNGANGFPSSSKKAPVWVCLECGYSVCGEPSDPHSHVVTHFKLTRHVLLIQCENPKLRWCFPCDSLLSFEKEENGEKKDLLLEVVKFIRERYSNTSSASFETTNNPYSGFKYQGSAFSGMEESRDGNGLRGLVNLGNTCFFNSVLQNLLSLDQLRDHFLKEDLYGGGGGVLFSSLKRLFVETKSDVGFFKSAINPKALFGYVCSKAPQFRGYQQQDSHELLRCLLDALSIEELSLREKKLSVSDSDDSSTTHQKPSLIDSLFGGEISSTVSCLECGHSSKVIEQFLDLSIPVPSKKPPPRKQETISQEKIVNVTPNKVLENNVEVKKDSETVSAKPELDQISTVSILETPSDMAHEDTAVSGIFADVNEADQVSESENMWDDDQEALTLMLAADSQLLYTPYKDYISYDDDKSFADSKLLYTPYKDGVSYDDDKTVEEGKCNDASSSLNVSGHHNEQTTDYVDFSSFFDEPEVSEGPAFGPPSKAEASEAGLVSVSSNDKTVKASEPEVSEGPVLGSLSKAEVSEAGLVSTSSNEKTVKAGESEVSEGPVLGSLSEAEVSGSGLMAVSSNDKTVKEGESEASSLFVFGDNGKNIDSSDFGSLFNEPETFQGHFGQPSKAGFMSDDEVLDDSDSAMSLDKCLAQFSKPEILSEDNAWHCENCSKKLKLQRLREKRETKEGVESENEATVASDECTNNSFYITIDDGVLRDSDTNQSSTSSQPANDNESEKSEEEEEDSKEVIVKTEATKRVLVNKAPSVLTIHLKRFSQDARGRLSKLSGHVDFSEFLNLSQYMDTRLTEEEDQPVYRLVGLVEHKGTMRGGHYVSYIRDYKDKSNSSIWYYASDYYVRRVSFEEVLRSEAYILFYQRI